MKTFLTIFREADLIYNENLDPVMRKIEVAHNIAVKIAQQWFGNAGNLVWYFNTLLLHQSFAILFGEEAIVEVVLYLLMQTTTKTRLVNCFQSAKKC